MAISDPKEDLKVYLQTVRSALVWKLEGLSEYDIRRPLVPTGTNLLGLVKHSAFVEFAYFGETFGRPANEPMAEYHDDDEVNVDMWATPDESRIEIVNLYKRAWAHADETIDLLAVDSIGRVAWWPEARREVNLHRILVHVIAETNRHTGQADIVRELIDGTVGLRPEATNVPEEGEDWWKSYHDKLENAATEAQERWTDG